MSRLIRSGLLATFVVSVLLVDPVAHATNKSSWVRDAENPARSALNAEAQVFLNEGSGASSGTVFANIPADRRLVIEYVSVHCQTPVGNPMVTASLKVIELFDSGLFTEQSFHVPLNAQGNNTSGQAIYVAGLTTRLYADPRPDTGGQGGVSAEASRQSVAGYSECTFRISGHTVKVRKARAN